MWIDLPIGKDERWCVFFGSGGVIKVVPDKDGTRSALFYSGGPDNKLAHLVTAELPYEDLMRMLQATRA